MNAYEPHLQKKSTSSLELLILKPFFSLIFLFIFPISVIIGGSLIAHALGTKYFLFLLLGGILLSFTLSSIINAFVTYLRSAFSPKPTFLYYQFVLIYFFTNVLLIFVILDPNLIYTSMKNHGNWLFDRRVALFFHLNPDSTLFQLGRKLTAQLTEAFHPIPDALAYQPTPPSHSSKPLPPMQQGKKERKKERTIQSSRSSRLIPKPKESSPIIPSKKKLSPLLASASHTTNAFPLAHDPIEDADLKILRPLLTDIQTLRPLPNSEITPPRKLTLLTQLPKTTPQPNKKKAPTQQRDYLSQARPQKSQPIPSSIRSSKSRMVFTFPPSPSARRKARFAPSIPFIPPMPPQKAVIPLEKRNNASVLTVKINGYPTKLLFDTGASYLSLSPQIIRQLGIRIPSNSPTTNIHTANGMINASFGILNSLTIGPYTLKKVAFIVCQACSSAQDNTQGLLGLNVLRHFLITFDHIHQKITITPQKDYKNNTSDIQAFLKFEQLQGMTSSGSILKRVFHIGSKSLKFILKGQMVNYSPLPISGIQVEIQFFQNNKIVYRHRSHLESIGPRRKQYFKISYPIPRNFQKFQIHLLHAQWP